MSSIRLWASALDHRGVGTGADRVGCGGDPNANSMVAVAPYPTPVAVGPAASYPTGLHVVGNQILDGGGKVVILHGANRSGTEYKCVQSASIFDGPSDEISVAAMASWHFNAVRVPLNESCWLGINGGPAASSGAAYTSAITAYVALLHKYGLIPIVELHWVAPGTELAVRQQPMPDADHAADFWTSVASTFAADSGVIFELYNEPYPDGNKDSVAGWTCWRDGCTANENVGSGGTPPDLSGRRHAGVGHRDPNRHNSHQRDPPRWARVLERPHRVARLRPRRSDGQPGRRLAHLQQQRLRG